jgi:hypothetical protein
VIGAVFFFGVFLGIVDLALHFSVARIFNFFK